MQGDLKILIDSREVKPLLFPNTIKVLTPQGTKRTLRLYTEVRPLKTGDYALANYERICLIERKASAEELIGNFASPDYARMMRCYERLRQECQLPVFLVEAPLTDLLMARYGDGETATDRFLLHTILSGVPLVHVRATSPLHKRKAGEIAARILIQAAMQSEV